MLVRLWSILFNYIKKKKNLKPTAHTHTHSGDVVLAQIQS